LKKQQKKKKQIKKTNILIRIFRFFIPKDFKAQLYEGMKVGEEIRRGKVSPKWLPTWWIGKGIRKIIDPKHNKNLKILSKRQRKKLEAEKGND